jgi:hypothetical protein
MLRKVEADLVAGKVEERTNVALKAMFRVAGWKLEQTGFHAEARQLEYEYTRYYESYVLYGIYPVDLGDHPPLSQWLSDTYAKLENLLDPKVMALLHLDDINILNYAIPVVLLRVPGPISRDEYRLHFAGSDAHGGFAGVVTYWGVWGACQVLTAGTGWFIVCTPAGSGAEYIMQHRIAPGLSDRIYDRISGG